MHKSGQTPDVLVAVTVSPAVYSQLSKKKKKKRKSQFHLKMSVETIGSIINLLNFDYTPF